MNSTDLTVRVIELECVYYTVRHEFLKLIYMYFRPQMVNMYYTRQTEVPEMRMSQCQSFISQKLIYPNRGPVCLVSAAAAVTATVVVVVDYAPGSTAVYSAAVAAFLR
jgi:hypothetical protein